MATMARFCEDGRRSAEANSSHLRSLQVMPRRKGRSGNQGWDDGISQELGFKFWISGFKMI